MRIERMGGGLTLLACLAFFAACETGSGAPETAPSDELLISEAADETGADVGSVGSALLRTECPFGPGECIWPTTAEPSLAVGAGSTAVQELGAKFVNQGDSFISSVTVRASRSAVSAGTLYVELRADATSPKVGSLLATGTLPLSALCVTGDAACDEAAQTKTLSLLPKRPLKKVTHRAAYWLRFYVDGGLGDVLLSANDGSSTVPTSMQSLVRGDGTGTTTARARSAVKFVSAGTTQLAFLPNVAMRPNIGCRDGIKNGPETDVDCGVACGVGCGDKRICTVAADCRGEFYCRPLKGGLDDTVCRAGELCACAPKLAVRALCISDRQCLSGRCSTAPGRDRRCEPVECVDGAKSTVAREGDVDCGGLCSARCVTGQACAGTADCGAGMRCLNRICSPPLGVGSTCTADDQCSTGICKTGTSTTVKTCVAPVYDGGSCSESRQCASQRCVTRKCVAPRSNDLIKNGTETDVDCGGGSGISCTLGRACLWAGDCASGLLCSPKSRCVKPAGDTCTAGTQCFSGICAGAPRAMTCRAGPACDDGLKNGSETDLDCGGVCSTKCMTGKKCTSHGDCASGSCSGAGLCVAATCRDGVRNGNEVDVDCGGATCGGCAPGTLTNQAASCASKSLTPDGRCAFPTCEDGIVNGTETGIDSFTGKECGGAECARCPRTAVCKTAADCQLGACVKPSGSTVLRCTAPVTVLEGRACQLTADCNAGLVCTCNGVSCASGAVGLCTSPTLCGNGIKDNGETDVDCGGIKCGRKCGDGRICANSGDCASGVCPLTKRCEVPTSTDNTKNGDETGVDCGGATAPKCPAQRGCLADTDCLSGYCDPGRKLCAPAPSGFCSNFLDIDCGRACSVKCEANDRCRGDVDCASLLCEGGTCVAANCFIDGVPYAPGDYNPANDCLWCDVRTPAVWTPRSTGAACDDKDPTTINDACDSIATCRGTPSLCATGGTNSPCAATIAVPDGSPCLTDVDCPSGDTGSQTCVDGRCAGSVCRTVARAVEDGPTIVCRTAQTSCDVAESCEPGNLSCPDDLFADPTTLCRAATGPCDEPEYCDGVSPACGLDLVLAGGNVCRPAVSDCDADEFCDGRMKGCPVDGPKGQGALCDVGGGPPGTCSASLVCEPVSACQIDGTWYRNGDLDSTGCKVCNTSISTTTWSFLQTGSACPGGTCGATGSCTQLPRCTISGVSYPTGARDATGCRVCDGARNPNGWSFVDSGEFCGSAGQVCDGSGACVTQTPAPPSTGDLRIVPGVLDFGVVTLGCRSAEQKLTLYNASYGGIDLAGIALSPASLGAVFNASLPSFPYRLAAGGKLEVPFVFQPGAEGAYSGTINVSTAAGTVTSVPVRGAAVRSERQTDNYTQAPAAKTDVLFVIDNSGSMYEEQQSVADNAGRFLSVAQQTGNDFQVAVITTDMNNPSESGRMQSTTGIPKIIRPGTTASTDFAELVRSRGIYGSGDERGLDAVIAALGEPLISDPLANKAFLRSDASLSIVIVSDEPDYSRVSVDYFVDFLQKFKGPNRQGLVSLSAVVGDSPSGCSGSNGNAMPGTGYLEVAAATGGKFKSICSPDWSSLATDLGAEAFAGRAAFRLTRPAIASTIAVAVNNQTRPASDWTYDPSTNGVIFNEGRVPAAGSQVSIIYDSYCF